MKTKQTFVYGLIAVVLALAFTILPLTGCDNGTGLGDDDPGGPSFLGDTLVLSGQVYEQILTNTSVSYKAFNGSLSVTGSDGGSGAITKGQLSYTVGIPTSLESINKLINGTFNLWTNVQPSSSNVQYSILDLYVDHSDYDGVYRGNATGNPANATNESVAYFYVNDDITISGKGKTETEDGHTYILKDLNLALKKGWNTVHTKGVFGRTTSTMTMSLSNPNLKWTLGSSD